MANIMAGEYYRKVRKRPVTNLGIRRTCEHWLKLQDSHRSEWFKNGNTRQLVTQSKSKNTETTDKDLQLEGAKTFYRFRVFFMACAEFFALNGGESWGVGHYLFRKRD